MKKKVLLILLVIIGLFVITGCDKKKENNSNKSSNDIIKIVDVNDKGYVTTFKTIDNKFIQTNPKYNHVDSDDLGVFITFEYIESSKEAYDNSKIYNFLGVKYSDGEVKEYKWNNYDGYFYNVSDTELYFRILLEDDPDNSIVLSGYVGPKVDSKNENNDLANFADSDDFQNFLNSIEFKKENK